MDKTINKKNRFHLLLVLCCAVVIFLNHKLGYYIIVNHRDDLYRVRFFASTFGYIFKPFSAYVLYRIICKPTGRKNKPLLIPVVINTLIFLQNLFTENVFTIQPDNIYAVTNTFLVCMPVFTAAFYFVIVWIHRLSNQKFNFYRFLGLGVTTLAIIFAVLIEKFSTLDILDACLAISIILSYLMRYIGQRNEIINQQKESLINQKNALLLSQIHPHFIYNTLNSIYYLCRNDKDEAAKALLDFSDYLHQTLDASLTNDLIPFSQEIETTIMYTNLEKMRFEYISINYFIEEKTFLIPPLSIQPIVENSIRHGIRGQKDGFVNIRSRRKQIDDNNYYVITIEDNGKGINKNNESLSDEKNHGEHSGIGIENVKNRLSALVDGTLKIESSDNGTTITITIPVEEI